MDFDKNKLVETQNIKIVRFKNGEKTEIDDVVVSEEIITVTLQCKLLGTLICTPTHIHDLVAGYLISSGIVWKKNKLLNIDLIKDKSKCDISLENNNILNDEDYTVMRPTGCAGGNLIVLKTLRKKNNSYIISITSIQIATLMSEFSKTSELFKATGGVHSAAITNTENIIVFREDIGRHNAVDKTIGYMYLNKQIIEDKILVSSGRISSEIVLKAAHAGLQIIISRSAPTLKGIELAEENNITLVGFARNANFNVYTHPNRILFC